MLTALPTQVATTYGKLRRFILKYSDSYEATVTMTAASQTKYSDWFDASFANEITSYASIAGTHTITTTLTATLQRFSPIVATGTDIAAHAGLGATGGNELFVTSKIAGQTDVATKNKIGMRVRWKCVTNGTWTSSQSLTVTLQAFAKRN